MTYNPNWTVEIKGPQGVKMIEIDGEQVRRYPHHDSTDEFEVALWLAFLEANHVNYRD